MSPTSFFPFGAYQQLSADEQAVVDSILLSEVIHGTARTRTTPETATELEHAFLGVMEAYTLNRPTPGQGDAYLALNRDYIAGKPQAIKAVQAVLVESNVSPQLLAHFTRTINKLVALDGHPLKLSD